MTLFRLLGRQGYTIAEANALTGWEAAIALTLDIPEEDRPEPPQRGKRRRRRARPRREHAPSDAPRPGYAYPDPRDPYSHLRMRMEHHRDPSKPLPEPAVPQISEILAAATEFRPRRGSG